MTNWFQRHLNWTLVLALLAYTVLGSIVAGMMMLAGLLDLSQEIPEPLSLLGRVPTALLTGWVFAKKRYSGFLGLIALIPYVYIPLVIATLCLPTKRPIGVEDEAKAGEPGLGESTPIGRVAEHDIRQQCSAYYQEELKLKAFQEKEADLYNEALVKYGMSVGTDDRAAKQMLRAANRLAEAANEILRRRSKMAAVPDMASAMYFAWQTTYSDYSAWTSAQAAAVSAVGDGLMPHSEQIKRLLSESEKSRRKAEGQEKKFLRQLKLSSNEGRNMLIEASMVVENENWQPPQVKKATSIQ